MLNEVTKLIFLAFVSLAICPFSGNAVPQSGYGYFGDYSDDNSFPENYAPGNIQEAGRLNWPESTANDNDQRRVRQNKNCQWIGCHKLPVGKQDSCPTGTFLESYQICEPKGSGNVKVQCCK